MGLSPITALPAVPDLNDPANFNADALTFFGAFPTFRTELMNITDIDGVTIGGTTPAAGDFTTLGATGAITAGAGIYIGGTVAANLCDDFERGTYTPIVSGGPYVTTPAVISASYTKIDGLVTVRANIRDVLDSPGSPAPSGDVAIGVPFPAAVDTECMGAILGNNVEITKYLVGDIRTGQSYFRIRDVNGLKLTDAPLLQWTEVRDPFGDFNFILQYEA